MKSLRALCRANNIEIIISPAATALKTEHIIYKGEKIGYINPTTQKELALMGYSFPDTIRQDGFPINERKKWHSILCERFGNFPGTWLYKDQHRGLCYFLIPEIQFLENLFQFEIQRIDEGAK